MKRLLVKLRLGEKIGLGFGLVGLLFLGVIWQYHQTLTRSLSDYRQLQDLFGAKTGHALAIENSMLRARRAEKDFLLYREDKYAAEVAEHVAQVMGRTAELGKIDRQGAQTGGEIARLIGIYHDRFRAIAEAWHIKGLDHNSGLQGAFRDTVHELEALAGRFKLSALYLQLLQIRRSEKDLGLRRESQYVDKVLGLIQGFRDKTTASDLDPALKERLLQEIDTYRDTFRDYAGTALALEDIRGGKGPFRQAAHRIEDLIRAHYIPELERNILQLRRREKDYLLRGDRKYVDWALEELQRMHAQVTASVISAEDKTRLGGLLDAYQRDFLALVEQNVRIAGLQAEMQEAVLQITPMVNDNVREAERLMREMAGRIQAASDASERSLSWIVAVAVLLGLVFTVTITRGIVRPLRRMAGLLDQLAYEEPVAPLPTLPRGRDEVNAMARSVNTMAEHRARFLAWWKRSMREAEGLQKLRENAGPPAQGEVHELLAAREEKEALLRDLLHDMRTQAGAMVANAERLMEAHPHGESHAEAEEAARSGRALLSTIDLLQGRVADS